LSQHARLRRRLKPLSSTVAQAEKAHGIAFGAALQGQFGGVEIGSPDLALFGLGVGSSAAANTASGVVWRGKKAG